MSDTQERWGIPGTYVFDLALSRQGYAINKMCNSLKFDENREAFKADEEAYMERYGLSEEQKQAIRERDWLRLTQLGGNLFFFLKLGATLGYGLYTIGAQMRGESYEQFMSTRNVPGAT
ncbi:protocatechuate 3,4-dioxygenase [Chromohalobacter sarecensis]|uniref:Protocatechuate 3,4-dioxygenase n=2 Tax=Chromohalobacter TaxID=42054 RepID=A0A9X2X1T1_9GAMM|nr:MULTISPECIES: protocatechuate 3,4-dioxygenase [Chromohalobacter]MCK0715309.1 protocatechuate 3,4-dioxygenase [Chromohalobacter sarecensis]MCK2046239.1 protocatechuate 3,4-dioxygenase [Chromohalobacter moromii]MCT8505337.1 protocatechuate 3,4-dioxygenase [Chromohalobacter moromii]CDQ34092.1 Gallate dioxygenase [Virgibacillus halodenitrificans]